MRVSFPRPLPLRFQGAYSVTSENLSNLVGKEAFLVTHHYGSDGMLGPLQRIEAEPIVIHSVTGHQYRKSTAGHSVPEEHRFEAETQTDAKDSVDWVDFTGPNGREQRLTGTYVTARQMKGLTSRTNFDVQDEDGNPIHTALYVTGHAGADPEGGHFQISRSGFQARRVTAYMSAERYAEYAEKNKPVMLVSQYANN